jgi:hypothetical protein
MKTDDLISQLTGDLKPVRVPENAFVFALKWTLVSFIMIAAVIGLLSFRGDLQARLQTASTIWEILSFVALLYSALLLASWTSSPGRETNYIYSRLLLGVLAVCTLVNFVGLFGLSPELINMGMDMLVGSNCTLVAMAVGILTGSMFTYKVRQGASTNPLKSGAVIGLAALGAGGVAITLHCGSANGMHILMWHFLTPFVAMVLLGMVIGKKIFRW